MRGVVCAAAVGRVLEAEDDAIAPTLILDPAESELGSLSGGGCFAFLFSSTLPTLLPVAPDTPPASLLWTNYAVAGGSFTAEEFETAHTLALSGAICVWQALKDGLCARSEPFAAETASKEPEHVLDDEKMEI